MPLQALQSDAADYPGICLVGFIHIFISEWVGGWNGKAEVINRNKKKRKQTNKKWDHKQTYEHIHTYIQYKVFGQKACFVNESK